MRRRTILSLLVALIGAMALLAAGCGGDNESASTGTASLAKLLKTPETSSDTHIAVCATSRIVRHR